MVGIELSIEGCALDLLSSFGDLVIGNTGKFVGKVCFGYGVSKLELEFGRECVPFLDKLQGLDVPQNTFDPYMHVVILSIFEDKDFSSQGAIFEDLNVVDVVCRGSPFWNTFCDELVFT